MRSFEDGDEVAFQYSNDDYDLLNQLLFLTISLPVFMTGCAYSHDSAQCCRRMVGIHEDMVFSILS